MPGSLEHCFFKSFSWFLLKKKKYWQPETLNHFSKARKKVRLLWFLVWSCFPGALWGADGNSCRESILTHVALRDQRKTEWENPNCRVSASIRWAGPVLPSLKTFLPPSWQQRGEWCWELARAGTLTASSGVELAASLCSRVMRAEALSWDNKIFTCLRDMYFPHAWAQWVRACSQWWGTNPKQLLCHWMYEILFAWVWEGPGNLMPSTNYLEPVGSRGDHHCQALGIAIYTHILNSSCSRKIWFKNSVMPLYSSDC